MKQTQQQIEKLKTLQESLDWAIDLAENQLPELKTALQEIKDKVSNITIDLSPVAKEETLNRSVAALSALIEDIPSKVAVTRVTDLVATENDKEYIANDYGVDGFGKVKTELRNLVKVASLKVSNDCINEEGRWEGDTLIDTTEITSMDSAFRGCYNLTILDTSSWNLSKNTSLYLMFYDDSNLTEIIGIENWDTSNVKNITQWCRHTALKKLDLRNWNVTSVTSSTQAFRDVLELEELDVSTWDTSNWKSIQNFFSSLYKLKSLDLRSWDCSNITSAVDTFYHLFVCKTLIGGVTIDEVINNNIQALRGIKVSYGFRGRNDNIDRASLRALINGLADVTDQPAESRPTLTLGATLMAKLTDEDRVIATEKGWNLA